MKYLTTLEAARQLGVSKMTLLNWLYDGKVPEPPRNNRGYRLWSPSRLALVRKLIRDGRILRRTVLHADPKERADVLQEYAREVSQFVSEAGIEPEAFLRELSRVNPAFGRRAAARRRR